MEILAYFSINGLDLLPIAVELDLTGQSLNPAQDQDHPKTFSRIYNFGQSRLPQKCHIYDVTIQSFDKLLLVS